MKKGKILYLTGLLLIVTGITTWSMVFLKVNRANAAALDGCSGDNPEQNCFREEWIAEEIYGNGIGISNKGEATNACASPVYSSGPILSSYRAGGVSIGANSYNYSYPGMIFVRRSDAAMQNYAKGNNDNNDGQYYNVGRFAPYEAKFDANCVLVNLAAANVVNDSPDTKDVKLYLYNEQHVVKWSVTGKVY